jgi:hypothetical protein
MKFDGSITVSNSGKPCCLGFKYEFFISRFEFGQKIKKKYSGHRVLLFFGPTTKDASIHHHGAVHGIRNQQAIW